MLTLASLETLRELAEEGVDTRRLGACPHCGVSPIWRNLFEFVEHCEGCALIAWAEQRAQEAST